MSFSFDEARDLRWRTRLRARLEALIADDRFEVVAAQAIDILVAPPYPVYPDDISVRWFEREGEAQGELRWRAIEPDAGDRLRSAWFEAGSEELEAAKQLYHFEDHPAGGEGVMVHARAEGSLVFHDSGRSLLLPLAIGFEDYVELQIATLGLAGVLDACIELSDHGWSPSSESAKQAASLRADQGARARATLALARRLFGDQDLALLERRVALLAR